MKAAFFLIFISIFLSSCDDKKTIDDPIITSSTKPLEYIPADFQFLASVDMKEAMKIPGLSDRLKYEAKRKPSLQIVPIEQVEWLYLAADSAETTENKGGIFIAELNQDVKMEKLIEDYKAKFKKNKDVIVSKKEFRNQFIYTLRDKKQELAVCQVKPNTIISGPLNTVVQSLSANESNIADDEKLKKLMKINEGDPIKIYLLSADKIGALLQQLKFFDQLVISAKPTEKGGFISLNSLCLDKETAEKAKGTLLLVQLALQFKIGKHTKAGDMKILVEDKVTTGTADLSKAALEELFIKK